MNSIQRERDMNWIEMMVWNILLIADSAFALLTLGAVRPGVATAFLLFTGVLTLKEGDDVS